MPHAAWFLYKQVIFSATELSLAFQYYDLSLGTGM